MNNCKDCKDTFKRYLITLVGVERAKRAMYMVDFSGDDKSLTIKYQDAIIATVSSETPDVEEAEYVVRPNPILMLQFIGRV